MILGFVTLLITWGLNKAIPSFWQEHKDRINTQVELARDLCQNHGDCEAQKAIALRGSSRKKGIQITKP
jgi:hypothetical protein